MSDTLTLPAEIIEAQRLIAEYNLSQETIATNNDWSMFQKAGCRKCNNGQIYEGGHSDLSVTYYYRCGCSKIPTQKYQNFLDNVNSMLVKDYEATKIQFFDNHSKIKTGNNASNRSW